MTDAPAQMRVARRQALVSTFTNVLILLTAALVMVTLLLTYSLVKSNRADAARRHIQQLQAQKDSANTIDVIIRGIADELNRQLKSHDARTQEELRELLRNTRFIIQQDPTTREIVVTRVVIVSPTPVPCHGRGCH